LVFDARKATEPVVPELQHFTRLARDAVDLGVNGVVAELDGQTATRSLREISLRGAVVGERRGETACVKNGRRVAVDVVVRMGGAELPFGMTRRTAEPEGVIGGCRPR